METPDPSRHSKNKPDPKTIDLGAEEVKGIEASEADGTTEETMAASAEEPNVAKPTRADDSDDALVEDPSGDESQAGRARPQEEPVRVSPEQSAAATRPEARAETVSEPRSSSGLSMIAASLIGGVVVLAGAAGLQYWGVLPSLGGSESRETVNLLSQDIERLKSQIATLESAEPQVDLGPVNSRIDALEKTAADMPRANGLSADADTRISALGEQINALEGKIGESTGAADKARASLEMRLEALEKKVNAPRDDVEVATAIAAAGLKAAIDRGGPFMTELDTLQGVAPDNKAVEELKPYAATGVPTRADLINQFPAVADRMLEAAEGQKPDQSLTDRLLTSAFSAIKVRPVGNVEGEGPSSIVARMEQKLQNGDLKGAGLEWDSLPDEAKAASSAYKKSLDARIRVEELVGSTLSNAVRTTGNTG